MHMADALVSPAVGATMWAASGAATVYSARQVRRENDPALVPLMGVSGAFVFAAQMLNFQIPGTGSSGHLAGGLLLAILLGPEAAFLVMASVLTVQALFFADGGLLSLGANIFNLGFFSAFVAYPLVYKPITGNSPTRGRIVAGSMLGAIVALQLGSLGVVVETWFSGVSALPLSAFLVLMQPIHLAIGVVEGIVTAAVVLFVMQAQPDLVRRRSAEQSLAGVNLRRVLVGLGVAALLVGVSAVWVASTNPDGLEWSIQKLTGNTEVTAAGPVHDALARLQAQTALMPDYAPRPAERPPGAAQAESVPSLVGVGIVLAIVAGAWVVLRRRTPGS